MGGDAGAERVVRAGRVVLAIGREYLYFTIPARPEDIRDFLVTDLTGDGKHAVLVRYVERGGGGAREVLGIWKIVGAGFQRIFAAEVAKQRGPAHIQTRVRLVSRGRAHDLVLDAVPQSSVERAVFAETPASDMIPMLLPWGPKKHARYRFSGDESAEIE
jgi:hypothetical protein